MHSRILNTAVIATLVASTAVLAPHATGAEDPAKRQWTQTAENSAPAPNQNDAYQQEDADGMSWAPGGVGAANFLMVRGEGLHVDTAAVAYNPGSKIIVDNVCVDEFEIAYYEQNERKVETSGASCSPFRATHQFDINRPLDANSPLCGRAKIGPNWGNYACITIKP